MFRSDICLACLLLSAATGFGQQPAKTTASFEIADVHVSTQTRNVFRRGPLIRNGRYEVRLATMVDLISTAYGIEAEKVLGGPNWLENDRFDVIAKAPAGATAESARPMLQSLLADRFGLTFHNDTRPIPAYGLKAGKHPQLKQAEGPGDGGCKFTPPPPPAAPGPPAMAPVLSYSCQHMAMADFAKALRSTIFAAPQYLGDRVVVDETELKGAWDFELKLTPKGLIGPNGPLPGGITLFEALDKIGLRLEPSMAPVEVMVVDRVNRTPTPNAPNVAEALHVAPAPTEFEVAELKPTAPDFRGMNLQMQPGGRLRIQGTPVKFLIEQAWDMSPDSIMNAPKWMETDKYDIVAKTGIAERQMDIDDLWPMLRALLTERFRMTVHTEERPETAYTLVSVKPKMKKADPTTRTKYKEGPAADGKDPREKNPILSRLVTCQNMTMAQFAAKLKDIAPGYIHAPVLDGTGLEGGYDFTLSFSPAGAARSLPGGGGRGGEGGTAAPGDAPSASEPTGAISLFEAIEKQLGLKLEEQRRPVPVLVIDKAERTPTEN